MLCGYRCATAECRSPCYVGTGVTLPSVGHHKNYYVGTGVPRPSVGHHVMWVQVCHCRV